MYKKQRTGNKVSIADCEAMYVLYRAYKKYGEQKTKNILEILEDFYFSNNLVDFRMIYDEYMNHPIDDITSGEDLYRIVKYEFPNAVI